MRPSMPTETVKMVACAIVSSRLDYRNSALGSMSLANFNKLKQVQYTLTRVVIGMPAHSRDDITPVLAKLY